MDRIELIATSTAGMESVVADEVRALGYEDVTVDTGKITYKADMTGICRSNLWLRTADRVKVKIGEFEALTFDELFEKTKALSWSDWIPDDAEFPVIGKSVKSKLFSISDCQAIVKKAVVDNLKNTYKKQWFEEKGPLYRIEVALHKDVATLTIDTSGAGLHKRGYRELINEAPLKETMAAGLVLLTRWSPNNTFVDPFCGSGTIPIEAALIGHNIAPGMNREFASEKWSIIPRDVWREARKETHDLAKYDRKLDIHGSDIDGDTLKIAMENAVEAGVSESVTFTQMPMQGYSSTKKQGYLICNPPYGERLGEREEVEELYKDMGKLWDKLDTWSFFVLTSHPQFEKLVKRPAKKKRKLYNGNIKVDYYQFYGSRK